MLIGGGRKRTTVFSVKCSVLLANGCFRFLHSWPRDGSGHSSSHRFQQQFSTTYTRLWPNDASDPGQRMLQVTFFFVCALESDLSACALHACPEGAASRPAPKANERV